MAQNCKEVIENRLQKVAELYLSEKTQSEIARMLGISEAQVSKDLKSKKRAWRELRAADFDERIAVELAKISLTEKTYWDAWERSKTNYKKKATKVKGKAGNDLPDYREHHEIEVIKDGDPRFLQGIERCIERRCKLLGLDAPIKSVIHDHSFLHFLMHTQE